MVWDSASWKAPTPAVPEKIDYQGIMVSPTIKEYFDTLQHEIKRAYDIAKIARAKNLDPEPEVPIPLAQNMAERVVGLISVVAPQILNTHITDRISELEKEFGLLDWRVGLKIAVEVAKEMHCKFKDKNEALEVGIRVGFAYLTLGIVSAPLEGFIGLKIKKRRDGKEYFAVQFAGPIRGAGGTAASTCVILSDYVRVQMGYAPYDPDQNEVNRYALEIQDYHERVTNLQYRPSEEEVKFMVSHLPVEVDGDPTERIEVSNYKDQPRIETNMIRGGVALVLAEGLCQKAPKLWIRLSDWGKKFDLDWDFMGDFIKLKEQIHASHAKPEVKKDVAPGAPIEVEKPKVKANNTFIMDLVAGRPILTHPLGVGGFRLRYGRNRTSGFSATAVCAATLIVLDKYIAIGTQLKVERPGKAGTITMCDTLEGPIVRLIDGTVLQLKTEEEAKKYNKDVEEILFLGDILFNYGDFSENGQKLVPCGYCPEWWALEVERALLVDGVVDYSKVPDIDATVLERYVYNPLFCVPTFDEATLISTTLQVPFHPEHTFYWKLVSAEKVWGLRLYLACGKLKKDSEGLTKIILPYDIKDEQHVVGKRTLEEIGCPHLLLNKDNLVITQVETHILSIIFGFSSQAQLEDVSCGFADSWRGKDGLEYVNSLSKVVMRDKAGTFIGARMGRPEKSKMRHLAGSPQVMFPVGEEGDRMRSFGSAMEAGKVSGNFPLFSCPTCNKMTVYPQCERCATPCTIKYHCKTCGDIDTPTCRHGEANRFKFMEIDIKYYFHEAQRALGDRQVPDLIKGIRGTSNKNHIVEHLSKGILRAKHNIYVNKDGTTRYDCTELPLTHFRPREIQASVAKLVSIGYLHDVYGNPLVHEDQLVEIKPQDVILPGFDSLEESAPQVLIRVAQFCDELLVKFYKQEPFYNVRKAEDLIGHLIIGLAPHISAGLIGRIIGFSQTQGMITHPMYHAGLRRDCDGDEACAMLLMDSLLNFSRQYLPERRGAKTMDSPLVLTSILNPAEVDDQVQGMDVMWRYPIEFYEAAEQMKGPKEVKWGPNKKKIEQIKDRLGTPGQFENMGFTHHVDNFNKGVQCSVYKIAPSMQEKLMGQMEIARKVRAVNMDDVAKLVIQKHFLKDIKGNMKKFSMQQFRCVKCNSKYRRPPLLGACSECGGRLIFTISEGSVLKYLGPSLLLAEKYDFSPYLKQTLQILRADSEHIFAKDKEKQVGLGSFIA